MPQRPVINIEATRLDCHFVNVQFLNSVKYFGSLCMPIAYYRNFINTMVTGSGCSGDSGIELRIKETDFGKWGDKS